MAVPGCFKQENNTMTLRSYARRFMSWGPRDVDLHEVSSDYFDFVMYFGVISLSMGMCECKPFTKDDSARDGPSRSRK
ncbi:MAG: hypothetical protein QOD09_4524 [Bradyrhizobium sp.]|jgi:hypothetical protein|nr:hypothetical protein [Bradyrhizobium sp.]